MEGPAACPVTPFEGLMRITGPGFTDRGTNQSYHSLNHTVFNCKMEAIINSGLQCTEINKVPDTPEDPFWSLTDLLGTQSLMPHNYQKNAFSCSKGNAFDQMSGDDMSSQSLCLENVYPH